MNQTSVFENAQTSLTDMSDGALEGITRRTLLELCGVGGIPAEERRLARIDLLAADEVFLAGTGARMVPVRTLDGAMIGKGDVREIYPRLVAAYEARVRADDGRNC